MFSGIVEEAAKVITLEKDQENLHITLECSFVNELSIDQSISHNGVCLTVVKKTDKDYTVTAIKETLIKSNLGLLKIGDKVNLERSMKINVSQTTNKTLPSSKALLYFQFIFSISYCYCGIMATDNIAIAAANKLRMAKIFTISISVRGPLASIRRVSVSGASSSGFAASFPSGKILIGRFNNVFPSFSPPMLVRIWNAFMI